MDYNEQWQGSWFILQCLCFRFFTASRYLCKSILFRLKTAKCKFHFYFQDLKLYCVYLSFTQTERLKQNIRSKVLMHDLEDVFERPTFNQTALKLLLDNLILVRENTTRAVSSLETILYLIKTPQQHSLKQILAVSIL